MRTLLFLIEVILIIRSGKAVLDGDYTTTVKVSQIFSDQYRYKCGWFGWWKCTGTRYYIQYTTVEMCCYGYKKVEDRCVPADSCGQTTTSSSPDKLIVGGSDAAAGEYPWLVSLVDTSHFCGGTIISDRWVLTSATCVTDWVATECALRFGEVDTTSIDRHEITMTAETFVIHEDFDCLTYANDIALIKTIQPIVFNDYARPACLPCPDLTLPVNTSVSVGGWGVADPDDLSEDMGLPTILQKAQLFVADIGDCEAVYSVPVTDNQICIKDGSGNTEKGTCAGDEGGPLMFEENDVTSVVGIISYGSEGGCVVGDPAVFTNVAKYIDWIKYVMEHN